ncbi:MAG: Flp family type IVb pilin [Pseudomonas sp.]|uniref:Flp family type IVb pilin n=1 Tax=Pseudomonas sp. TaxID=306 RepID=UPI003D0D1D0B
MSLKSLYERSKQFIQDEAGASGIEYAIVAAMVAVVLAAFMTPLGDAVVGVFSDICVALGGTGCPTP